MAGHLPGRRRRRRDVFERHGEAGGPGTEALIQQAGLQQK